MSRESQAADHFARHKAGPTMRALVENLRTASTLPYLVSRHKPCERMPAFIVGAGPSLSASLGKLRSASQRGMVFAVNASARAVSAACDLDVLVVRESLDVASQLEGVRASLVALDAQANPAAWRAAEAVGPRGWFMAAAVQHFALHGLLGVRAPYCGPSAVTAAVALAEAWGCSPIVLVGCDLAMSRDGQAYASESGWGDVRGAVADDGLVRLEGLETMRAVAAASGQHAAPVRQSVERFPAWDGEGEVTSLLTWGDQVRWLASRAKSRPGVMRINATAAGARIDGWRHRTLDETLEALDEPVYRVRMQADVIDTRPAIEAIRADARVGLEGRVHLGTGVIEAMAAGDALAAKDSAGDDVAARIVGAQTAYSRACSWVLDALSD
jgi:hypothetical protein